LNGVPSDPTTVILKARKPDGTVFEPPVNHPQPGSGYYYADIVFGSAGLVGLRVGHDGYPNPCGGNISLC
jgi:hypothetical protein